MLDEIWTASHLFAQLGQLFRSEPSPKRDYNLWGPWPLERESRAIAVLEKVRTGLERSPSPIHVPTNMTNLGDAIHALCSCSTEGLET